MVAAIGIVLAAVAAYVPSFAGVFVFDDEPGILRNETLRHLWGAWWPPAGTPVSGRPVANFSFALDYILSGTHPWSYHATNLLIHLLAALALFGIVRRTLATPRLRGRFGAAAVPLATTAALLWALHPLQTEAVTYVVQRVESLMALFYLLTFYAFVRYAELAEQPPARALAGSGAGPNPASRGGKGSPPARTPTTGLGWAVGCVAACLLGAGTKEVTATAPVLVFLFDRTFFAGSFRAAWRRRRWLYVSLAATWLPLAALVASTGWNRGGTAGFDVGVSPWAYWLTQPEAITRYLRLAAWPYPQIFDYPTFWVHHVLRVLLPTLALTAFVAATLWALWRRPAAGFLGAWILVILSPTSVVPGTIQMIVEHRMYLPLAAVAVAAAVGVYRWLGRRGIVALLVGAAALGTLAARRNTVYHSARSLWSDTVAKCPDSDAARNNLGNVLAKAGDYDAAIANFQAAARLRPHQADTHYNLATALAATRRTDAAIAEFEQTLRLQPGMVDAHVALGKVLARAGRTGEALDQFHAALRLAPSDAAAHSGLGLVLAESGRAAEAAAELQAALRLDPRDATVHANLGRLFAQQQRLPEAVAQYQQALALDPAQPDLENNLGIALLLLGRPQEAIVHFEAALRLNPNLPQVHLNLAAALQNLGRTREAQAEMNAARRLGFSPPPATGG